MKGKLVLPILLVSMSAHAIPTLYPQDFNFLSKVVNTTNSDIVADDTDPKTLYVMPPNEGYGAASGLHTITANVSFCQNMKGLHAQTVALENKAGELRLEMGDQIKQIQAFETKITAAKEDEANYATANHLSELLGIQNDIDTATQTLTQDEASLDKCTKSCDDLEKDAQIQLAKLRDLSKAKTDFEAKNLESSRVFDQKHQLVKSLGEQKDAVTGDYNDLANQLDAADAQVLKLYTTYASMEGARASFDYDSNWNANVATLRQANPGLNIVMTPTQNAHIFPGILGVPGMPATGAIMGFEIPGATTISNGSIAMTAYPPGISGNAVLSLLGACPMLYPNYFDVPLTQAATSQKFGMLISYEYPSTMKVKLTAKYNMYKMYQLIKSSGSSGGFFSSSSWSSTEERTFFRDAFTVNWSSQDPGNTLSDDQRIAMERDVRNDIYSRLFSLALTQNPDPSKLVAAAPPGQHGSVVIADSLMKVCPGNIYCVAGSLILQSLDAIFGSSSTSSSYTNIQDVWVEDSWSYAKVVYKPGITSYKAQ